MPIPAAAALAAGASLAGNAINSASTARQNKKSREFQVKMFDKTNQYNSPIEQRKRLESAGLNPNLIYGSSAAGAAGNTTQPAKPDFNVPEWGNSLKEPVAQYYSTKNAQANLEVQSARTDQIKQQTVNASIDAIGKTIGNKSGALNYRTKKALFENTLKTAEQRLDNLSISNEYTRDKNRREESLLRPTLAKLQVDINNAKKTGENLTQDNIEKKIDNELRTKYNLRPSDPMYYRIIGRILSELNIPLFKD